jgi:four helix bundle protein
LAKGVKLAVEIFKVTERFPREEKFGLTGQTRRAGTSVPTNIAEGWGRGSTKEYIQFLLVARGSLLELETHLIIAQRLQYLRQSQVVGLEAETTSIGRMLNGLIQALRARGVPLTPSS